MKGLSIAEIRKDLFRETVNEFDVLQSYIQIIKE
jgi:hypothetical protein